MDTSNDFNLVLEDFQIAEFFVVRPPHESTGNIHTGAYSYAQHGKEEDQIVYCMVVSFLDEEEANVGMFSPEFTFRIPDIGKLASTDNDNRLTLPKQLDEELFRICYDTSRGMVFSLTNGTFLEGIILPVISSFASENSLLT